MDVLDNNPKIKKGVIMKRPPRYDNMADESEYANFVLDCLGEKAKAKYGDRLVVAGHSSLYLEGARRDEVYGVKGRTQGYDGVHLRGPEGQKTYTASVAEILVRAGLKAQWQEVRNRRSSRGQEARREVRRQEPESPVTISNRFSELN